MLKDFMAINIHKRNIVVIGAFNYIAYLTQTYLLFIILKSFSDANPEFIGVLLTITSISTVFIPLMQNVLKQVNLSSVFKYAEIAYIISLTGELLSSLFFWLLVN